MKKKLISLALVLAMLFTLMPMAFADSPIDAVTITGLPAGLDNTMNPADVLKGISTTTGTCSLEMACLDTDYSDISTSTSNFQIGHTYMICLAVKTSNARGFNYYYTPRQKLPSGAWTDEDSGFYGTVTCSARESADRDGWDVYKNDASLNDKSGWEFILAMNSEIDGEGQIAGIIYNTFSYTIEDPEPVEEDDPIDEIVLNGVPQTLSTSDTPYDWSISVPEDANYEIDMDRVSANPEPIITLTKADGSTVAITDSYVAGETYTITVQLVAKEGYYFPHSGNSDDGTAAYTGTVTAGALTPSGTVAQSSSTYLHIGDDDESKCVLISYSYTIPSAEPEDGDDDDDDDDDDDEPDVPVNPGHFSFGSFGKWLFSFHIFLKNLNFMNESMEIGGFTFFILSGLKLLFGRK